MAGRELAISRARMVKRVLLDYGAPEVSIEVVEGRPFSGDRWNALRPVSVFSHHIVSRPTPSNPTPGLNLVTVGTSDLGGPLCNGTAGVDLVYRIKCLGLANHPGFGGPLTVSGPLGSFTIPRDNARPYAWGTEYEGGINESDWDEVYTNRRTGISMSFREFMGRCNAGLTHAIWLINDMGKTPEVGMDFSGYHAEHLTWAPDRKIDRLNYTTRSGRAEVRRYTDAAIKEDDVQLDDDIYRSKDKEVSVRSVLRRMDIYLSNIGANRKKTRNLIRQARSNANDAATVEEVRELLLRVVDAVEEALDAEEEAVPTEE